MSNLIRGKNITFSMFIVDTWYPIFCAKSGVFERVQEEIEVTSTNSGADREYIPGMRSATFSLTGITTLNNTNNRVSVLYADQQSRSVFSCRCTLLDNDGNSQAMTFSAIMTRWGFTRDVSSYSQSSIDFRITGAVTHGAIISAPGAQVVYSDYWNTTPGANTVTGTSVVFGYDLTGITPLGVYREGVQHDIITTGTPSGRQVKYNSGTPNLQFDATIPFASGEKVFMIFKE